MHSKAQALGGIPGVVSCEPEVLSFKIASRHDFVLLATGIFDKMDAKEAADKIIKTKGDSHSKVGLGAEKIIKLTMER